MPDTNAKEGITKYAVRLGDDALVLGHRLSEWCSSAPFLEEDLALTNVALDFIGRARMFYSYAAELTGGDCTEDSFAYLRDCRDFTNLLIHELPRGDFAFTMARQYLVDEYNLRYMERLLDSADETRGQVLPFGDQQGLTHGPPPSLRRPQSARRCRATKVG